MRANNSRLQFCHMTGIAIFGVVMALSCKDDYDFTRAHEDYNKQQESYISNFTETFGSVSDNHSWTCLSDGSVSFPEQMGSGEILRLYTSDPRFALTPSYLLAEFRFEEGKTYNYQYPEGLRYLYATIGLEQEVTVCRFPAGRDQVPDKRLSLGDGQVLPEHKNMRYILAYDAALTEKKHTSYDFDFNDCVIAVDYVQGQPTATMQLLCAGTTDGVKVTYMRGDNRSNPKDETIVEEIHAALGIPGYYDSWDKLYRYDIIGTQETANALKPVVQPTYTIRLNEADQLASHVLGRICCLFGPEDDRDSDKQRLCLQLGEGFRLGQVLCIPDERWTWPVEGTLFTFNFDTFCQWLADHTHYPFWYSSLWKNTNHAEELALEDGDVEHGCRLEIDSLGSFISAGQLEYYTGHPATLTLLVDEMIYGARISLCKYPQQTAYYSQTIKVDKASCFQIELSAIDLRNLCGPSISGDTETGLEIQCSKCRVSAAYIR